MGPCKTYFEWEVRPPQVILHKNTFQFQSEVFTAAEIEVLTHSVVGQYKFVLKGSLSANENNEWLPWSLSIFVSSTENIPETIWLNSQISVLELHNYRQKYKEVLGETDYIENNWKKYNYPESLLLGTIYPGNMTTSVGFKIFLKMEIESDPPGEISNAHTVKAISTLQNDLSLLFENMEFSDITIVCQGKELKAHKNILAHRNPVFKALIAENPLNKIEINIPLNICQLFLEFLYTGIVSSYFEVPFAEITEFLDACKLFQMKELQEICAENILHHMKVENAVQILVWAFEYDVYQLKTEALAFIKNHRTAVMMTEAWKEQMTVFLVGRVLNYVKSFDDGSA